MEKFVRISFTGRIKNGRVFDTTDEEIARSEGIFNEDRTYGKLPIVIGAGHVIKGLDEALSKMKKGEEKEIEIPPEKAFGKRDPNLVRLVPLSAFKRNNINPIPGMVVELDGKLARIQTVSGGRVRVDFNHELAGKTVIYKVKIEDVAKNDRERIKFLVERNFNSSDEFNIRIKDKKIEIEIPENVYKDRNLLLRKAALVAEIFRFLEFNEVKFIETWKRNGNS
ncbi:MAG: peptidylprolyl isomerase [Candidatus Altiarchaeales archaeon]|nr:MAG: peptidylprolyl isomerase [Candidatus Altiarchaeales archaeon]RLI93432.1 MAG: peptidylprolyl isomerase [Candidatus Altiarchaeales archaeon]RLI94183.1 MAG: peptidylprolyl isomerase [Candidatus Altiarchaeales archaeon]